ncbi:hypothetical protein [Methylovirgula sp. 4M-Z18]|uniref:hypothetical protein n=1 Tax=Methylovirgula sp. 4M-Z18 TaxID=2293567 RepID=UPI000E2FC333|nr:hypothetical protein [Methylovirgula sp. 4M-Z18]RFB76602.1 hypothetical protein DYH55_19220 [Methylovirgula sp. 4M-Z18]
MLSEYYGFETISNAAQFEKDRLELQIGSFDGDDSEIIASAYDTPHGFIRGKDLYGWDAEGLPPT